MRYLILSDIHGNREALESVVADARGQYDSAISCGDLCDYGPDSNYVVDWARENLSIVIRGNHDRVCAGLDDMEEFTDLAQASAKWTMEHLTPANRNYLRELPQGPRVVDQSLVLVHGSPRDEDEYVTNIRDVGEVFTFIALTEFGDLPVFFGHTHVQGVYTRAAGRIRGISAPLMPVCETEVDLERDSAYLINPGSVGQPRDGDPRAAYAIFDSKARRVTLRRVSYNHVVTERKIEVAGLPKKLGLRLAFGR
jgi:predicted phosphodiesterase